MTISERVQAHRYLYFVLVRPVIPDFDYDRMNADAKKRLPESDPIHRPGSDREADYPDSIKAFAYGLLGELWR